MFGLVGNFCCLWVCYVVGLLILLGVVGFIYFVYLKILEVGVQDVEIINVSGCQCMFSQCIVFFIDFLNYVFVLFEIFSMVQIVLIKFECVYDQFLGEFDDNLVFLGFYGVGQDGGFDVVLWFFIQVVYKVIVGILVGVEIEDDLYCLWFDVLGLFLVDLNSVVVVFEQVVWDCVMELECFQLLVFLVVVGVIVIEVLIIFILVQMVVNCLMLVFEESNMVF